MSLRGGCRKARAALWLHKARVSSEGRPGPGCTSAPVLAPPPARCLGARAKCPDPGMEGMKTLAPRQPKGHHEVPSVACGTKGTLGQKR